MSSKGAMQWVDRIFGEEAFRLFEMGNAESPPGHWLSRRYDLIYEAEMVGFALFSDALQSAWTSLRSDQQAVMRMALRSRFVSVMTDDKFRDSINEGTRRPLIMHTRLNLWNQALETALQDRERVLQQGTELLRVLSASNICPVCSYPIAADDAAWGTASDGQARLVHRACRKNRR